nr:glycosyltransferase [Bifidobacterium sp. 7101]
MNATNILERNIAGQPYVPDRYSFSNRQIPQGEVDSPVFYGSPKPVDADIVIPIYNEEIQLADSVSNLCSFLDRHARDLTPFSWNIVIADNASTDASWQIAMSLCDWCPNHGACLAPREKGSRVCSETGLAQLQGSSRRIYGCGSIYRHRFYGQPYSPPTPRRG